MENDIDRDEFGNAKSPELPAGFWEEQNQMRNTCVFHFKGGDGAHYPVNYEKFLALEENPRTDLPKFELVSHHLFDPGQSRTPDSSWAARQVYESWLNRYFRPVLAVRQLDQAFPLKIDYFTLVVPKDKLEKMRGFIREIGLFAHEDFVLYLIARIEDIYVRDIAYYDLPEVKTSIKQFPKEIDNLIKVLSYAEPSWSKERPKAAPELQSISFRYKTTKAITVTDHMLTKIILDGTKENLSEGRVKGWKKRLESFPAVNHDNQLPNEFRGRICKALHNFFKGTETFQFGDKETTDDEMYAIAGILDFALVSFYNKRHEPYCFDTDKADIKQQVRLLINRKELTYHPVAYTAATLKTDFEILNKYFDPEFIAWAEPIYSEYDLRIVGTTLYQYDLQHLLPQMIHIFKCLRERAFQIGHQFSALLNSEIEKNQDYRAWKAVLQHVDSSIPVGNLKLSFTSGGSEHTLEEQLSQHLIGRALSEFIENHRFEFENDFYESSLEQNYQSRSFRLAPTGKLHKPYNRFLPTFCRQCYQFLLREAPPADFESQPSEKYYAIIASLLKEASFFNMPYITDSFLEKKVEEWHRITPL